MLRSTDSCILNSAEDGAIGRLLGTAEVAELLRVPIATIYKWRAQRIGPRGFRVGRHTRFRLVDVERWITEQVDGADGRQVPGDDRPLDAA